VNVLKELLSGLSAPVADYFKRRMEIKAEDRQQERAIKKAITERQIALIEQGQTADANWEMEFARQAQTTWKDEYTLIVTSIPAVMAFIPGLAVYVSDGFKALSETPPWYQMVLISLFLATVGIRYWRRSQTDT
jgi:hypothetical protein